MGLLLPEHVLRHSGGASFPMDIMATHGEYIFSWGRYSHGMGKNP